VWSVGERCNTAHAVALAHSEGAHQHNTDTCRWMWMQEGGMVREFRIAGRWGPLVVETALATNTVALPQRIEEARCAPGTAPQRASTSGGRR